ncbi:hypothetical protein WME75_03250 [Sorangium sp. So ce1014]|uniref:hypothetical protein n=1 Tax=Sorangium sp. So ce1014 TaxID=3133326 RepID=UPI003F61BA8F
MMHARGRTRAIAMAAALLSLGAGAALAGASCIRLDSGCRGEECRITNDHTCPWNCSPAVWDSALFPDFNTFLPYFVWTGNPRDAPDCTSANAYHEGDFYRDPKSLDRCPRCVAEPVRESRYHSVELRKGAQCVSGEDIGGTVTRAFMIPVEWDGSCISEVVALDPAAQDADVGVGRSWGNGGPSCAASLSRADVEATWGSLVRVCQRYWEYDEVCWNLASQCVPDLAPEFRHCLKYDGDEELPECPPSHPELVQAYTGVKGCSACGAEDPLDDGKWRETTATLTFYADEQCTQPLPTTNIYDKCFNVPPGSLPRSVTATLTVERVSACEAVGGEQEGELEPEGLVSFCCKAPR